MTRPSEHEEVRDLIAHWVIGTGYYSTSIATDEAGEIAEAILASDWLDERDRRMKAEAWEERDRARGSYLGPNDGHYDDCYTGPDCDCQSWPNPYA